MRSDDYVCMHATHKQSLTPTVPVAAKLHALKTACKTFLNTAPRACEWMCECRPHLHAEAHVHSQPLGEARRHAGRLEGHLGGANVNVHLKVRRAAAAAARRAAKVAARHLVAAVTA
jgi:hypothetical protein